MPYVFVWSCQGLWRIRTFLRYPIDCVLKECDLLEVVRSTKEQNGDGGASFQSSVPEVKLRRNDFRSSTKLEALVQNLRRRLHNVVQEIALIAGDEQVGSETRTPVSER